MNRKIFSTLLIISMLISIVIALSVNASTTAITFLDEPKSNAPLVGTISVVNNKFGVNDTVTISDLLEGDIVTVYSTLTGATILGTKTVADEETNTVVNIGQVGAGTGNVFVSITRYGFSESSRTAKLFLSELSIAALVSNVTVINNFIGTSDTVKVTGLVQGAVIKVYNTATGLTALGSETVLSGATEATVSIPQIGVSAGSLYVSITSPDRLESARVLKTYISELTVLAPIVSTITVVNNFIGTSDTITLTGLKEGNIVNVYTALKAVTPLASVTVAVSETTATISIDQLGIAAGYIYVALKGENGLESTRTTKAYISEVSLAPDASNIIVKNNASGTADTVKVSGMKEGDTAKVYDSDTSGKLLGMQLVATTKTEAVVSIAQIGSVSGSVYVSVITKSASESVTRTKVDFIDEVKSTMLDVTENSILITNNTGTMDKVVISDLAPGDIIKVFKDGTTTIIIGTAIVPIGSYTATVTITQLGQATGIAFISVKRVNEIESARLSVHYNAEGKASAPPTSNFTIVNNAGISDSITYTGEVGDLIKIYKDGNTTTVMGTGKVAAGTTTAVINIAQLGATSGSIFVSLTTLSALESATRTTLEYSSEVKSTILDAIVNNIVISNKTGSPDTIFIENLIAGDIIKVYKDATSSTSIGTSTVLYGATSTTVSIVQMGQTSGTAYLSITSRTKLESIRLAVEYIAEAKASAPESSNFLINNNAGMSDTITYIGKAGDTIKVYRDSVSTTVLGSGYISAGKTVTLISISQIGGAAGSIFVSLSTSTGLESATRTEIEYDAEVYSTSLDVNDNSIVIVNKTGSSDTIALSNLTTGDIIKVYKDATDTTVLGTVTVAIGASTATVSVAQLGQTEGFAYITLKSKTKLESDRLAVGYSAEVKSEAPNDLSFTVVNNAGIYDTLVYIGKAGDTIKIYRDEFSTTILGTGTVVTGKTIALISIAQLGSTSGSVYATLATKVGLESSTRTKLDYSAEVKSLPLNETVNGIVISNKTGSSDAIAIENLTSGDVIKVYKDGNTTIVLGRIIVAIGASTATLNIAQLGQNSGKVFLSLTSLRELESDRLSVDYIAEGKANAPDSSSFSISNSAGLSDTIIYTGNAGDIIKVYKDGTTTAILGTGTISAGKTSIAISIAQLGSAAGSVQVSLTTKTALESATRTQVEYDAEVKTESLEVDINNIVLTNRAWNSDIIVVHNLAAGDVIKIYKDEITTKLLTSGKVLIGGNSVTVSVAQLGLTAGNVYISVTSVTKLESARLELEYIDEVKAEAPNVSSFTVVNNSGTLDIITYTGSAGDTIKIYKDNFTTTIFATGKILAGKTSVEIRIPQIGISSGNIYATLLTSTSLESETRTELIYAEEEKSGDLTDIVISGTPSNFAFDSTTYTYSGVIVGYNVSSIIITPTGSGVIKVGNTIVPSRVASAPIALTLGVENIITVYVTEFGKATKTYVIKVTRTSSLA